jgi:Skp family chaperone for outer membrane proteins
MHPLFKIAPILLFAACQPSTAEHKTVYVNTAHVAEKMNMRKALDVKLAEMREKKQPEMNQVSIELESVKAEIANSKIQEADYMNELREKKNHLHWKLENMMKSISDSSEVYNKRIITEMDKKILAFGKENEYQFILPMDHMLYGDSALDITHQVIEYINK